MISLLWRCSPPRWASSAAPVLRKRFIHRDSSVFRLSEEVRNAVNEKRPVVALETTIYTHGFPFPENLDLSTKLEALVRHNGGVPAHCAVLDGVARVGLAESEMLGLVKDTEARKVSRRDLGYLAGLVKSRPTGGCLNISSDYIQGIRNSRINGGTTIAGTMILAHMAGIKVFATGGLGGVHRGFEDHMDVSADLTEFGRTPVAVVSAGCKGFLDIPRTLEYLETEGAVVATFADGREGNVKFPAFWCRESDSMSPLTIRDEVEAAAMIHAQSILGLTSGLFFPNPVPEELAIPPAEMSKIIDEALSRTQEADITGSANTPYVLNAIKDLSKGRSVVANEALIEANVIRGTRIAVELSRLERGLAPSKALDGLIPSSAYLESRQGQWKDSSYRRSQGEELNSWQDTQQTKPSVNNAHASRVDLIVAGSVAVDVSCDYKRPATANTTDEDFSPKLATSNPAIISQSIGGVGYNITGAAQAAGASAKLFSVIGKDLMAKIVTSALIDAGLVTGGLVETDGKTAQYVAFNDSNKNLIQAMADMNVFETVSPEVEERMTSDIRSSEANWFVIDSNWSAPFLHKLLQGARSRGIWTAFEPVSVAKSRRIFSSMPEAPFVFPTPLVNLATPNVHELSSMYGAARESDLFERKDWWRIIDAMGISPAGARVQLAMATSSDLVDRGVPQQSISLLPFLSCILTKLGSGGVLLTQLLGSNDERLTSAASAPYILTRSKTDDLGVGGVYMRLFPPAEVVQQEDVVSVNGVGDTLLGVLIAALIKRPGLHIEDAVDLAQRAAVLTLKSSETVSPEIAKLRLALEIL